MDGGLRDGGDDQPPGGPDAGHERRGVLIGLIVVVALVACGVYIINVLRASARLQDCEMQGRTNCTPIGAPGR